MPPPPPLSYHPMSALNSTILNFVAGEDNQLAAGAFGTAAVLATTVLYYALSLKDKDHEFTKLRGIQLYHAWNFFQRRHDFLQWNFKRNLGKSFSFNVLHHNVIALIGQDARQAFYSNQHLAFDEGYKILMGGVRAPHAVTECSTDPDIIGTSDQRCGYSKRREPGRKYCPPQQKAE